MEGKRETDSMEEGREGERREKELGGGRREI